jgi:molybdopterin-containing oxidoreductase family iron-sulfur binding subunit
MSESRRAFLEKVASAIFAGMVLGGSEVQAQGTGLPTEAPAVPQPPFRISDTAEEDVLLRMQKDLERALEKPMRERKWGMVIDTRKCGR